MNMGNLIFENWHQWKVCFIAGCKKAAWGIWRIITCMILGIVSIFAYIGRKIESFCRREPVAALTMTVIIAVLSFGWLSTFMDGRVRIRTAEYQRDSIGYKLDKYLQCYDSSAIVIIDNDTIR